MASLVNEQGNDNSTSRHAPFYVFHEPAETTESRHDHDLTPLHFTFIQIPQYCNRIALMVSEAHRTRHHQLFDVTHISRILGWCRPSPLAYRRGRFLSARFFELYHFQNQQKQKARIQWRCLITCTTTAELIQTDQLGWQTPIFTLSLCTRSNVRSR